MARFSPLFFKTEPVRDEETLIITINAKLSDEHKRWLASDQAVGIWNYALETVVVQVPQPFVGVSKNHSWARAPSTVGQAVVVTTIWFTDVKTAMAFKLTFG